MTAIEDDDRPSPPNAYVPPGPLGQAPGGGHQPREVRAGALGDVLAGIELGDYDRRMIEWLTGLDDPTCRAFASIMWRCREAGEPRPPTARVRQEIPADALRALAGSLEDGDDQAPGAGLAVGAVRNLARYAPAGKRVRVSVEWQIDRPR